MVRSLSMSRLTVAIAAALALSGGAHAATSDPLEGLNRKIFAFNEFFDEWVGRPVATFYRNWVPQPVRTGASNVFSNIGDVFSIANNLLQAKPRAALEDTYRVVLNTTIGIGGIFDLATDAGIEKHGEDFGQTLGVWGVGSGPYLVLPFLGPSSLRDATGTAVHAYWDPVFYLNDIPVRNAVIGWRLVDQRALLLGAGQMLDEIALDKYTFMRDFYLQRRRSLIYDGDPPDQPESDQDDPAVSAAEPASAASAPAAE